MQTQTQTQIWRNALDLIKKGKVGKPLKEQHELVAYTLSNAVEYLKLRKAKELQDAGEANIEEKASEYVEKVLERALELVKELEEKLSEFPIEVVPGKDSTNVEVCVRLSKYVDAKTFNSFKEMARKLGLRYTGYGNCVVVQ